ncbi:MFS transporter [Nonomuraea fastidiosa]|jgi:predicted MFS family arabinose efflux permease|uniref:MFS transporter n=1 Tax=Nonomuraea fastidiosa TaxID=46173 RepID=UPI003672BD48
MTMTEVSSAARARWLAVTTVAVGTFTVVTSEMLPVGLLTSIADDLGVSPGTAGLSMTAPGLVAAVAAPVLAFTARGLDRRLILMGLMALLGVANVVAAAAPDNTVMLAARVLTGVSIGGFWAFAAALGARLVPERSVGRATSIILGGVSVASVLGVPAATFVSSFAGWRSAFAAAGALSIALLALLAATLPPLRPEADDSGSAAREKRLAWLTGPLVLVLVLTALTVSGHFAAYTYVRPFLEQVSQAGPAFIGTALLLYGVAGVIGNFASGARAGRNPRSTFIVLVVLMTAAMLALALTGMPPLAALLVWGVGYGGVGVALQLWLMREGGGERGTALYVSAFNLSIALGALAGGRITDAVSVPAVMWTGAALTAVSAVVAGIWGRSRTTGS